MQTTEGFGGYAAVFSERTIYYCLGFEERDLPFKVSELCYCPEPRVLNLETVCLYIDVIVPKYCNPFDVTSRECGNTRGINERVIVRHVDALG